MTSAADYSEEAPLADDVDYQKLAQFEMAGGNMKGAVFRAAARAALRDEGVGRRLEPLALHLLHVYSCMYGGTRAMVDSFNILGNKVLAIIYEFSFVQYSMAKYASCN